MIIVAGKIYVQPSDREAYLEESARTIELARAAHGCLDFHLAADPIEPGRINVFEQWSTAADVEAFRGSGPPDDQTAAVLDAAVFQHDVASSERL